MTKCTNCGTGWTSSGLPICPVCGTRVESPVASSGATKAPEPAAVLPGTSSEGGLRKNGSAVMEIPTEIRKPDPVVEPPLEAPKLEPYLFHPFKRVDPAPAVEPAIEAPKPELYFQPFRRDEPAPAPVEEPAEAPVQPEPAAREVVETPEPEPYLFQSFRRDEPAPRPLEKPAEARVEPAPAARKSDSRAFHRLQLIDQSAATIPAQGSFTAARELPAPARPLSAPLVLGILAYVAVVMLPWTVAFENHRVLGILGFCITGLFAPLAPIAWMVGLSAEKRRREQGLRSERRVSAGRLLGQWATLILVAETTVVLMGIAALRLAGLLPVTFWTRTW